MAKIPAWERVANKDTSESVTELKNFYGATNIRAQSGFNASIFGYWHDFEAFEQRYIYAVYSYGQHFPMYVFDKSINKWFGNYDKYSRSTTKHQAQARPHVDDIEWTNTDNLLHIIRSGGLARSIMNKAQH